MNSANEKLCFKTFCNLSMKANLKTCCLPSQVRSLNCLLTLITVSMILILCFKDLRIERRQRDLKHDIEMITSSSIPPSDNVIAPVIQDMRLIVYIDK